MKLISILLPVFLIFPLAIFAQDIHKIGVGINYHLDQESSPGFQLSYQWQLGESFEFETRYIDNNEINLQTSDLDLFATFEQFSLGANFIKQYNNELSIKAGTGLGFVTKSSNESVVEKHSMAPYLMFATAYQLDNNFTVELGQFSHFNSQALGTHHSFYLSFNYVFGKQDNNSGNMATAKPNTLQTKQTKISHKTKEQLLVQPQLTSNNTKPTIAKLSSPPKKLPLLWYVQFGAFNEAKNGQSAFNQLTRLHNQLTFQLIEHQGFHRILSNSFNSKQRAEDYIDMVKSNFSLQGYVTQLALPN